MVKDSIIVVPVDKTGVVVYTISSEGILKTEGARTAVPPAPVVVAAPVP